MDAGDGLKKVMGLVYDHHVALQLDPGGFPGASMEQHVVGKYNHLHHTAAT